MGSSKREDYWAKIRRAARLVLFRSGGRPGVRGRVLKRALGRDYVNVLLALDRALEPLGLELRAVTREGERVRVERGARLDDCWIVAVLREPPTLAEARASGWRVDDLAILAATLLMLVAKGGSAPRQQVVDVLRRKFRAWRVNYALDRFVKAGYLEEDGESLKIGWRARAEIDLEALVGVKKTGGVKRPEREGPSGS